MPPYAIAHAHEFIAQLRVLPATELPHVLEKIQFLESVPEPDAKSKKRLHGYKNPVYRIRCGDYRIIYTFKPGLVTLLGVDGRKDVYRNGRLIVSGLAIDPEEIPDESDALTPSQMTTGEQNFGVHLLGSQVVAEDPVSSGPPIADCDPHTSDPSLEQFPTESLLRRLLIPDDFWSSLLTCQTVGDLSAAPVPPWIRDRVFDALVEPNFDRVIDIGQIYAVDDVDDYRKFWEGTLVEFLLRLDDDQRRYADWSSSLRGPTLLKGGPGTGKSTIAIYRVRSLLRQPSLWSGSNPRILFTTYTNALTKTAKALLQRLLGDESSRVDATTADSIIRRVFENHNISYDASSFIDDQQLFGHVLIVRNRFLKSAKGSMIEFGKIDHLTIPYLSEEILKVIICRGINSFEEYRDAPRKGRQVRLSEAQRRSVWAIYEELEGRLAERDLTTWAHTRRRALQLERQQPTLPRYDGVIIDEAQDLEPNMIRLLVNLCDDPSKLFITADANQSIC